MGNNQANIRVTKMIFMMIISVNWLKLWVLNFF